MFLRGSFSRRYAYSCKTLCELMPNPSWLIDHGNKIVGPPKGKTGRLNMKQFIIKPCQTCGKYINRLKVVYWTAKITYYVIKTILICSGLAINYFSNKVNRCHIIMKTVIKASMENGYIYPLSNAELRRNKLLMK